MKSKRYTALATAIVFSLFLSMINVKTVNAQTLENNLSSAEQVNVSDEIVSFNEALPISKNQNKSDDSSSVRMKKAKDFLAVSDGDSYEVNNGPAVATTGKYNQITYATIHNADDVDWYKIEVLNAANPISLILTDTGNGAYWIGFYKMLAAGGQGIQLEEKIGQIELMYSGDDELLVKQEWLIGGHILASTNFVWEPNILFIYKFPATIQNINYL